MPTRKTKDRAAVGRDRGDRSRPIGADLAHGRRLSRRGLARGLGCWLGIGAVTLALPAGRGRAADEDKSSSERPSPRDDVGLRGVDLLREWAAGRLPRSRVPPDWSVHAPPLGAGFFYPRGWAVTEIADPNRADFSDGDPFGVWVVAPDGSAAVLMLNQIANAAVPARDAAWRQLRQAADAVDVVALADDGYDRGNGVSSALVAARVDANIAAVHAFALPELGTGRSYLYFNLVIATADVFDAATAQVFLPLLQNLVTGNPGDCDRDPSDDSNFADDCWDPDQATDEE